MISIQMRFKPMFFDNVSRRLQDTKDLSIVKTYSILPDDAKKAIASIHEQLKSRYEELMNGNSEILDTSPLLLLVLNSRDAIEAISEDASVLEQLKDIVGRYKNLECLRCCGRFEIKIFPIRLRNLLSLYAIIKSYLYFDDIANMKIIDFPLATMRTFKKPVSTGDCYYIDDNECKKVKSTIVRLNVTK